MWLSSRRPDLVPLFRPFACMINEDDGIEFGRKAGGGGDEGGPLIMPYACVRKTSRDRSERGWLTCCG